MLPITMIGSTVEKVIDDINEVIELVLYQNNQDITMYDAIRQECDYVKKVMGEVLSLLLVDGLRNVLCERYQEINFKCTIGDTHVHIGKYLWYKYQTTVDITSDENDEIIETENDNYEVNTNQNHNYMEIWESGLDNALDMSSTNQ